MNTETKPNDSWWHERQTRPADFESAYHSPIRLAQAPASVWKDAALVVGVIFALLLSLAALASR